MITLPLCRWRGDPTPAPPGAEARYFCGSPSVRTRDGSVSASTCRSCALADHEPRAAGRREPPPATRPRAHELQMAPPACVHRGRPVREDKCDICGLRNVDVEVRACAVHGECTSERGRRVRGVRRCQGCPDATEAGPAARDIIPGMPDPIPEPALDRYPADWHARPAVRDRHIAALRHLASCPLPAPEGRRGDGIVIAGGGRYWAGAVVCATMCREMGSSLPIQIWHRGRHGEPVRPDDVAFLGNVEVIDADARFPGRRAVRGWETKTLAILHSGFRRVLWLDADCYPVIDPTRLFAGLDHAPLAYWRDTGDNLKAPWYGLTREDAAAVPPLQGGQYLVDVAGAWRELILAHWIDQHSDYFYARGSGQPRGEWHQYGDQDSWRAALALTGGRYHLFGPARLLDGGWCFTHSLDGEVAIVHRHGSKMITGTSPKRDNTLPMETLAWELFRAVAPLATPAPKPAPPAAPKAEPWAEMPAHQRQRVLDEVRRRAPCRVLVFGAGSDTAGIVEANKGGRTVVLEDQPPWLAVGREAGAECHAVAYATRVRDGVRPDVPPLAVPASVTAERFDVVLIDGPCGSRPDAPGRQQPAALAARLTAPGGVILAHDAERGAAGGYSDAACYAHHLGRPAEVVPGPPDLAVYRTPPVA